MKTLLQKELTSQTTNTPNTMKKNFALLAIALFVLLTATNATAQEKENWGEIGIIQESQRVNFKSFTGTVAPEKMYLNWIVPQVDVEATFLIERSVDRFNFTEIGFKTAVKSPIEISYSWIDKNPVKGNAYYRIKQISTDGTITMSKIITIITDVNNMADNR